MSVGKKSLRRAGRIAALLAVLAFASVLLPTAPAYAAGGGDDGGNLVMEFFGNIADGVSQFFGLEDGVETYAAGDETIIADGSTIGRWQSTLGDTTENLGRIWTDKIVSKDNIELIPLEHYGSEG